MRLADQFPPGTDLCKVPVGLPPPGQSSNLDGPATQLSWTIGLGASLTVIAAVFTSARIYGHISRLGWSDGFVVISLLIDFCLMLLMIATAQSWRHMWDLPLCMIRRQFMEIQYAFEILCILGLFFAKSANLLLSYQLFTVSARMRLAIRIGLGATFALYATSFAVLTWAVGSGAAGTALDLYILTLPLSIVPKLRLPTRKRIQVMATFLTALLAVLASTISLVYRVRALSDDDKAWIGGIIKNCNLAEMNVATIVASAPGFARFLRLHVSGSKLARSTIYRLGFGSGSVEPVRRPDPNQPRAGRDNPKVYCEVRDTILLKTGMAAAEGEGEL